MIAEFIDPAILGFILVGVMLFAIFVGFPISFTLIFLGFVFGYFWLSIRIIAAIEEDKNKKQTRNKQ